MIFADRRMKMARSCPKERILIVERMFQNGRPITVKDIIARVEN